MMFPFFKKKAPPPRKVPSLGRYRSYASAEQGRLMRDWLTPSSSSDSELWASQKVLRNRSRALVRDNSYARRIRSLLQGNIVGQGIGMQCVRNDNGVPRDKENDSVEQAAARSLRSVRSRGSADALCAQEIRAFEGAACD